MAKTRWSVLCALHLFSSCGHGQIGPQMIESPPNEQAPASPPAERLELVGEYSWRDTTLHLLEADGLLRILIPDVIDASLHEATDRDVFFVEPSADDFLRVQRDTAGAVTAVECRAVVAPRRALDPGASGQLGITPVRPLDELRREALAAQPPFHLSGPLKPDLVAIAEVDPDIHLDVRYAGTNNFLGTVFYGIAGAWLQRPAAEALARVNRTLRDRGYGLLVFDGYRPWYVTRIFWDAIPEAQRWMVADPVRGSRHNRGSAVDLTLYDLATGEAVVMTGTFDEATSRSRADYPGGTSRQRWLRALLRQSMEAQGFRGIQSEWWHFDYQDWERYPILNLPLESLAEGAR